MLIELTDHDGRLTTAERQLLENILQFAAQTEKLPDDAEVSVMIVSNDEIKRLNGEYRNKDEATDVVSYPLFERDEIERYDESMPLALGDIVISYDRAKEQAQAYGHSFARELALLAVHGFLHLLGYTHDDEANEKQMFTKQERLLKEFQLERS